MANFNLDGIQFTADNTSLKTAGKKKVKFGNVENGDFSEVNEYGVVPFVNAVEIDWNSADMGNLTTGEKLIINTTGQLLSYMSNISEKITNLENILINL